MFVLTLVCLRVGVHLFSLIPPTEHLYPMYGVSLLILAATIFLSMKFRGNVLEARLAIPKSQLKIRPLIPYFLFMGGVQVFIAALKVFVEPAIEQNTLSLWMDVASSVVSLSLLWLFGTRIKKKETFLRLFFILMLLAFASHQVFGTQGELLTSQFMEPAFLCWDVFLYSMIVCLFFNYAKQHMRLRIVLLTLFLVLIFGQTVLISLLQNIAVQGFFYNGFIYVAAFALFMLIGTIAVADSSHTVQAQIFAQAPPEMAVSYVATDKWDAICDGHHTLYGFQAFTPQQPSWQLYYQRAHHMALRPLTRLRFP